MARLEPPLVVIGQEPHVDEDEAGSNSFRPPLATWYDECHGHFVAQIDERGPRRRRRVPSDSDDAVAGTETKGGEDLDDGPGVEVAFQTLSLPQNKRRLDSCDGDGHIDEEAFDTRASDAFNSAKEASLVPSSPVRVTLPDELAQDVPVLAKFSLDMRLLALQFSPKLVRIVRIDREEGGEGGSGTTQQHKPHKQWTVDLSVDAAPLSSSAHSLPSAKTRGARRSPAKRFLQPRKASSFAGSTSGGGGEDGVLPGKTAILPGGVLWSNHGGNSEDLILITTTTVLFYKVSTARNHMSKSRAYPHHPSGAPAPAAGFWYEPRTRALLVGSLVRAPSSSSSAKAATDGDAKDSPPQTSSAMEMRTFFLRSPPMGTAGLTSSSFSSQPDPATPFGSVGAVTKGTDSSLVNTSYYSFPRLELPPPEMLQPFAIGRRGEGGSTSNATAAAERAAPAESIRLDDIALVCAYGDAFCIDLGGGIESDVVVRVFHLDKAKGCAHEMTQFGIPGVGSDAFVSVVDNVILVHSRESKRSLIIDLADADSVVQFTLDNDSAEDCNAHLLYESNLSFLPPSLLLDPSERGLLYRMSIDLAKLVRTAPRSNAVIPFLLRRRESRKHSHRLALATINDAINDESANAAMLNSWIESVAEIYEHNGRAAAWDHDACLPFIARAALLETDGQSFDADIRPRPPSFCDSVLTQTEIVEEVFLPQAQEALASPGARPSLHLLCDVVVSLVGSLERRNVLPCPALMCLAIALLWRLGEDTEIHCMLRARHQDCMVHARKAHRKRLEEAEMGTQQPEEVDGFDASQEAFAEMLVALLCNIELGINTGTRDTKDTARYEEFKLVVLTHAMDMLCSISSYQVAAKHLLSFGRVLDAITVCSKAIVRPRMAQSQGPRVQSFPTHGTRADDFFRAAVKSAEKMDDLAKNARLFHHLHTFIKEWDPDSLKTESRGPPQRSDGTQRRPSFELGSAMPALRRSSSASSCSVDSDGGDVEQSVLAHKVGKFPHELFGGKSDPVCATVREMFGFAN